MKKRSRYTDNHYNNFRAWREKVLNAYDRYERKRKIENAGGELEVARKKLTDLKDLQEKMKVINKAYKAYKKNPQSIIESGLSESHQKLIIGYVPKYSFEPNPFPTCSLTNNNAKIKNTEARIKELESKEEKASSGANKEINFEGGICVYDYQLDRITIKHDVKPDSSVIKEIKSHGFKWSPFHKVWMRKITNNAIYVTEKLLLPKLTVVKAS